VPMEARPSSSASNRMSRQHCIQLENNQKQKMHHGGFRRLQNPQRAERTWEGGKSRDLSDCAFLCDASDGALGDASLVATHTKKESTQHAVGRPEIVGESINRSCKKMMKGAENRRTSTGVDRSKRSAKAGSSDRRFIRERPRVGF